VESLQEARVDAGTNEAHAAFGTGGAAAASSNLWDALTLRAVVAGLGFGALIAAANVYAVLMVGFLDSGALVVSVLAYALFVGLGFGRSYTPQENIVTQAVASGAGAMSAVMGLSGPTPALQKLGVSLTFTSIGLWGIGLGGLGLLMAVLLRPRLLERENLPFPSGAAVGHLVATAHAERDKSFSRARWLLAAMSCAAVWTVMRDVMGWLPTTLGASFLGGLGVAALGGWAIAAQPLAWSMGALMGSRGAFSLMLGSLTGWVFLAPRGAELGEFVPDDLSAALAWMVWPGVALLVASLAVGLFADLGVYAREWRSMQRDRAEIDEHGLRRNVPAAAWILGLLAVFMCGMGAMIFYVEVAWFMAMFVVAAFFTVGALRATGETDTAPVGAMATLMLIVFAWLAGSPVMGVIAATIVAGMITKGAYVSWSFRAAAIVNCPARAVVLAHLFGLVAGTFAGIFAYEVVVHSYTLGSAQLPAPGVVSTYATALATQRGGAPVSAFTWQIMATFAGIGLVLAIIEHTGWRHKQFLPSVTAMAIGFIMPSSFGGAVGLGALAMVIVAKVAPNWSTRSALMVTIGLLAGESLMGLLVAAKAVIFG
jgi:uncharacterized oligopeptide transporter (OPT) family protein